MLRRDVFLFCTATEQVAQLCLLWLYQSGLVHFPLTGGIFGILEMVVCHLLEELFKAQLTIHELIDHVWLLATGLRFRLVQAADVLREFSLEKLLVTTAIAHILYVL